VVNPEFLQTEAYIQLQRLLNFRAPLSFTRGWAASPDFLLVAVREILSLKKERPVIVEAGSGVSTVILGYMLEKFFPGGVLISLEHDFTYYEKTKRELEIHRLSGVRLIHAPLVSYFIDTKEWLWYDTDELRRELSGKKIDVLLIDGPPEATQKEARYPAVPVLRELLTTDFLLLLDDASRDGEKKALERWKREIEVYEHEILSTEKGTLIFRAVPLKKRPFFSVCIPTYNRSSYLKEAIESVLSQTYPEFELIIYDDGSTDDTQRVVSGFSDNRIRYIKGEKNRGRPYARNRCVELARGEWIVWLDDDDRFKPDLLSAYALDIEKFPDVSVFYPTRGVVFYQDSGAYSPIVMENFFRNRKGLLRKLIKNPPIPNPASCINRKLFEDFGGYSSDFPRAQDYEFWSRVLPHVEAKGVNVDGFIYRIHSGNVSANTLKMDYSYESVIKRKLIDRISLSEFYYFAPERSFELFSKDLLFHEDYFNALYYLWLSGKKEVLEKVAGESGIIMKGKKKKLERRFFSFIKSGNYRAAFELSEKLGKFHRYISLYFLQPPGHSDSVAALKRAVMINPLFNLTGFVDRNILSEISPVKERILTSLNRYEGRKGEFINWIEGEV